MLWFSVVWLLTVLACKESEGVGTGPAVDRWVLSGKTFIMGTTVPLAGVLVKCGGMSAESRSDGTYSIQGIVGGTQTLTAEKAGCENYTQSIEITSDTRHHIFLGFRSTDISGHVTNAIEGPIKGARVELGKLVCYTDVSGNYRFIGAARGDETLSVFHGNYSEYNTTISLTTQEMQFDIVLKRDSVFQGRVYAYNYVDQASPTWAGPRSPNLQFLQIRANGYDSAGVYHDKNERNIIARFDFPTFMSDKRVAILEASLQMCIAPTRFPFRIETYALTSFWSYSVTYSTRPSLGALLLSVSVGASSVPMYSTVLDTDGANILLEEYRARGQIFGFEIKGGTIDSVAIFSSYATQNQPKITFRVRF